MMLELNLVKDVVKWKSKNQDITLFGYTNQMSTEKKAMKSFLVIFMNTTKIMNETNRSRMNLFIKNARKSCLRMPEIQLR